MKSKIKKISFKIDVLQISLNQRKFTTSEIGRGIGVTNSKKGKGSYTRNGKHKKDGRYCQEANERPSFLNLFCCL